MYTAIRLFALSVFCITVVAAFAPSCAPRAVACYDAGDCPSSGDQRFACIDGGCEEVDCLTTADCAIGNICDTEDNDYECEPGCDDNSDCLAGFRCDEGDCVESRCRSSILDCHFGEFCNTTNGRCQPAGGLHCRICNQDNTDAFIDPFDLCNSAVYGNPDCGGNGNHCARTQNSGAAHCFLACTSQADCPHGYTCSPLLFGFTGETCTIETNTVCLATAGCP